jgi:hypothetical protein
MGTVFMTEEISGIWDRFQKEFELPFKDDNCENAGKSDKPQPDFRRILKLKLDTYLEFFKENFTNYHYKELSEINLFDSIETSNKVILDTLEKHYDGKLLDAYELLFSHLDNLFGQIGIPKINYIGSKIWFRISGLNEEEIKDPKSHLDKNRIYHIPFNERTKVSSYRYSIAGFPSLYLGENLHVCSEEVGLNIPVESKFIGSAFRLKESLKVIRFLRIEQFRMYNDFYHLHNVRDIIRYLGLFPFMISSSFKVCQVKDSFKPEYIIPQMLLSFVRRNDKIDGIVYPSTKIDYSSLKEEHPYNLVMPVKTNCETGYCDELRKYFHWTEPQLLSKIYDSSIVEGTSTTYDNTVYGKMEAQLTKDEIYTKIHERDLVIRKNLGKS